MTTQHSTTNPTNPTPNAAPKASPAEYSDKHLLACIRHLNRVRAQEGLSKAAKRAPTGNPYPDNRIAHARRVCSRLQELRAEARRRGLAY